MNNYHNFVKNRMLYSDSSDSEIYNTSEIYLKLLRKDFDFSNYPNYQKYEKIGESSISKSENSLALPPILAEAESQHKQAQTEERRTKKKRGKTANKRRNSTRNKERKEELCLQAKLKNTEDQCSVSVYSENKAVPNSSGNNQDGKQLENSGGSY